MKKQRKSKPAPYRVAAIDAQRFRGSIFTILVNFAVIILYGVTLKLSVDSALALILFSLMAILQIVICGVIGLNFNSKMWLISAIVIFMISGGVVIYAFSV